MRGAAGPEPAATPAHLVLVDVASRPPADPGPPRLVRFADLVPAEFGAFREAMRAKVTARQEAEDKLAAPH